MDHGEFASRFMALCEYLDSGYWIIGKLMKLYENGAGRDFSGWPAKQIFWLSRCPMDSIYHAPPPELFVAALKQFGFLIYDSAGRLCLDPELDIAKYWQESQKVDNGH
jgi:hypothetical protein